MEINARVYAVAQSQELLDQVCEALSEMTAQHDYPLEILEPDEILPLSQTWYGFMMKAEPTHGHEAWQGCLEKCAEILYEEGAVLVEFRSPNAPDDYLEYAYTDADGWSDWGDAPDYTSYEEALDNEDVSLAMEELMSGRTSYERAMIAERRARKEALRRKKGDFEITASGVLKKYRGLEKIVIVPDGVREIGKAAFVDDQGVQRLILDDEDYDAPPMKKLILPEGLERINYYAFAYCLNLEQVIMPDTVTFMDERAFEGCESLKNIRLSAGLEEIAPNTFFLCEGLKSITIPEGVRVIRENAFNTCGFLKKVVLPESLITIEKEAFSCCPDLARVKLPSNLQNLDPEAFPPHTRLE